MKADNVLQYKGYTTFVHYDAEEDCLYGEIEGIRSHISYYDYEKPVVEAFHEAVDDYLEWCAEEGSEPEKPYEGCML